MIERMRYFSMVGPAAEIDAAVKTLAKYDIHYVDAVKHITINEGIQSFNGVNPYAEVLSKAERFISAVERRTNDVSRYSLNESIRLVDEAFLTLEQRDGKIKLLQNELENINRYTEQFRGFAGLPVDLRDLDKFKYMNVQFALHPDTEEYAKFETMMSRHLNAGGSVVSTKVTELETKLAALNKYVRTLSRLPTRTLYNSVLCGKLQPPPLSFSAIVEYRLSCLYGQRGVHIRAESRLLRRPPFLFSQSIAKLPKNSRYIAKQPNRTIILALFRL